MFGMVNVERCRLEFAVIHTQHLLKQEVSTRQSSAFSPPHCRALPNQSQVQTQTQPQPPPPLLEKLLLVGKGKGWKLIGILLFIINNTKRLLEPITTKL